MHGFVLCFTVAHFVLRLNIIWFLPIETYFCMPPVELALSIVELHFCIVCLTDNINLAGHRSIVCQ
jgi:hypothetical protein